MKDPVREAQLNEVYEYLKASFMKNTAGLTADEKAYLRKIIAEHLEFYRSVVESSLEPTAGNQKLYQLLKGIWEKLI